MSESDKARLLLALRRVRITDSRLLGAMEAVPRERFVAEAFADQAYSDVALPIESGQTISPPSVAARMIAALSLGDRMKVLEVGTGSGYQAAVLARLCRRVYTMERRRDLYEQAEKRFRALNIHNITGKVGNGFLGWPEQAPFDRILLTAAVLSPPEKLVAQITEGGLLVMPEGSPEGDQMLVRLRRTADGLEREEIGPVRFIPLMDGEPVATSR
ncbi:MAG: protein-L-isoaspartate O-methyltransferase [Rhodospirillaceae bacterium]|nr:protein-L-isoaspartate O-methyltransferase [Rhodospirillaceae bacterium]|tara:strand:+ start:41 stop:685 length:645 start_codon:yes stop_codon:yes gene_type:complete